MGKLDSVINNCKVCALLDKKDALLAKKAELLAKKDLLIDYKDNLKENLFAKKDDLISLTRLNEILEKHDEEQKKNKVLWIFAIIGGIAAIAGIAYAIYRFLNPRYLDEFEDYPDEEFDDEFFDEEDEETAE